MSDAGNQTVTQVTDLFADPSPDARLRSQILPGESVELVAMAGEFAHCSIAQTGVEGFVRNPALVSLSQPPTHIVAVPFVHLYAEPRHEAATRSLLPLNALVACTGETSPLAFPSGNASGNVLRLAGGGWIPQPALRVLSQAPPAIADTARLLVNAPFLPGGRSHHGYDEGGLLQAVLEQSGLRLPHLCAAGLADLAFTGRGSGAPPGSVFMAGSIFGIACGEECFVHASRISRRVVNQSLGELCRDARVDADRIYYADAASVS